MDNVKQLVQAITQDRKAMDVLCKALLENTEFVRNLIGALNEEIRHGARLHAK